MKLLYALDGQGRLYFGSNQDYEIRVVSPEGKVLRTISRDYDPVPITQADKDEMLKLVPNVSGVNVKDMIQFPDAYPAFGNFVLADEGRLLVRTYEKGRARKSFTGCFDAEGRYLAQDPRSAKKSGFGGTGKPISSWKTTTVIRPSAAAGPLEKLQRLCPLVLTDKAGF
jgi:hypothetical protein